MRQDTEDVMTRDLFGDVVERANSIGQGRWYTVPLSVASHLVLVVALIVVPLTATGLFPTPQSVLVFAMAAPAPPAPPPPDLAAVPVPTTRTPSLDVNAAPLAAPDGIRAELPYVPPAPRTIGVTPSSTPVALEARTPATIAAPPAPSTPLPVGGAIREPRKTHHVPPVYPAVARAARRTGMVIIEATIAKDGHVRDARLLRSDVLFDQAALDAVREWRYTVPTLNGVPVDVTMTVTVRFSLD